jgi:type II secretory pathway component GspD/PulD (secretin)
VRSGPRRGVETVANLAHERSSTIVTRSYRISFSRASELQAAIAPLLSSRGGISVLESTNTMIVSDIERVQRATTALSRWARTAQSQLDTSQAQAFLGNWTDPLTTDRGP